MLLLERWAGTQDYHSYSNQIDIYIEKLVQDKQGGLKQLRMEHKVVTIVSNEAVGNRCSVFLLDRYISKLPDKAKEMDLFYCRPSPTVPKKPEDSWYIAVPIGKNTLSNMVKDIFAEAGIEGKKSNHSLTVAGATSLFSAGVPERISSKLPSRAPVQYNNCTINVNYSA